MCAMWQHDAEPDFRAGEAPAAVSRGLPPGSHPASCVTRHTRRLTHRRPFRLGRDSVSSCPWSNHLRQAPRPGAVLRVLSPFRPVPATKRPLHARGAQTLGFSPFPAHLVNTPFSNAPQTCEHERSALCPTTLLHQKARSCHTPEASRLCGKGFDRGRRVVRTEAL